MSRGREGRRLLRLRGWGRDEGIHGRIAGRMKPPAPIAKDTATHKIEAMRRAAALYLTSRECVARDVAFLLLPHAVDVERQKEAYRTGDLMVFTRKSVFLVGFAPAKHRPGPALVRMAGRIRDLGQSCRIIHAETPAHAVEQLVRLIDGDGGEAPRKSIQ